MQTTERRPARVTGNLPGRSQKKSVDEGILPKGTQKSTDIPVIDTVEAKKFLNILDPDGLWNFQTFLERGLEPAPGKTEQNYIYFSKQPETFEKAKSKLIAMNKQKACVSFCPNECQGRRTKDNVKRIRAFYVDCDVEAEKHPFSTGPRFHLIVQTSEKSPTQRRFQGYILINEDCPIDLFSKIQTVLAKKFCPTGPDTHPANPAHPMRLPGFLHQKGDPFQVKIIEHNDDERLSVQDVIDLYGLEIPEDEPEKRDQADPNDFDSDYLLHCIDNNEQGDSWLFRRLMSGRYCYDSSSGIWYSWNGNYWQEDKLNSIGEAVAEVVHVYAVEADKQAFYAKKADRDGSEDEKRQALKNQNKLVRRIYDLQTIRRQQNVIKMSQRVGDQIGGLSIVGDEWDKNQYILPCSNGLVNILTGEFRPGTQGDYSKTVCPTEWRGLDEPCPTWEKFISEVLVDENLEPCPGTAKYLQMALGMAITGDTSQHLFLVFWGEGQNGKGTLFKTFLFTLGPLAKKLDSNLLIKPGRARDSAAPREDLMSLRGVRLVWCNETSKGDKLDVSMVKELAGGDPITCRPLHGKPITFDPSYLVCLATNHKPVVPSKTDDPALWRRVVLVPFRLEFVDWTITKAHERVLDRFIEDKLKAEASGILAWLVKGAMMWRSMDQFAPPDNVKAATDGYKEEFDYLGMFIRDRLITKDEYTKIINSPAVKDKGITAATRPFTGRVQALHLYEEYKDWCDQEGYKAHTNAKFGKEIKKRIDFEEGRKGFYTGIELRTSHEGLIEMAQPSQPSQTLAETPKQKGV